jgi:hypothetical protein
MNDYEEWEKFVAEHWSQDFLDNPGVLAVAIETRISRAVLAEWRRILAEVRSVAPDGGFVADIVELTLNKEDKGENE